MKRKRGQLQANSAEKQNLPAQCLIGSDIKFYIIALDDGAVLYFPSMSSLERNNYLILEGHRCSIVNLVVS